MTDITLPPRGRQALVLRGNPLECLQIALTVAMQAGFKDNDVRITDSQESLTPVLWDEPKVLIHKGLMPRQVKDRHWLKLAICHERFVLCNDHALDTRKVESPHMILIVKSTFNVLPDRRLVVHNIESIT